MLRGLASQREARRGQTKQQRRHQHGEAARHASGHCLLQVDKRGLAFSLLAQPRQQLGACLLVAAMQGGRGEQTLEQMPEQPAQSPQRARHPPYQTDIEPSWPLR